MSLLDIKNKLYRRKDEKIQSGLERVRRPEGVGEPEDSKRYQEEDVWGEPKKGLSEKAQMYLRIGLIAVGGILLLTLSLWGIYKFRQASFASERVEVAVSGPSELRSGKEADFEITWKNNNRASLKGAVLKITYPENFNPEENSNFKPQAPNNGLVELGDIKGHGEGKFVLSGKNFSPKGAFIYIQAELIYTPSNINTRFSSQNRLGVNITSSPITLDISYPQAISNGDKIDFAVSYRNTGEEDLANLNIDAVYPDGFEYVSSEPAATEADNKWNLADLKAGSSGNLKITGRLKGDRDEVKTVEVSIGSFERGNYILLNKSSASVKLTSSPLFITQTVNEKESIIASAGDSLKFKIMYRNDGDIPLRDVIVTEKLVGVAIDYATLDFPNGGDYDSATHTIVWKAVDYPELKNINPGQGGEISFTARIHNPLPVKSTKGKNFTISSLAQIDSPDVPTPVAMNKIIPSNVINIKVNSQLTLETLGFYYDETIPNSGPIPPKVDQETTYTIHWKISNASSDLENAKVEVGLPTGIFFTGKISPENENLKLNERTNILTWDLGNLENGVGIIKPARTIAFQIRIKPSVDQAETSPTLLNKSVFSGKDAFTSQILKVDNLEKTTLLDEDRKIGTIGARVVN